MFWVVEFELASMDAIEHSTEKIRQLKISQNLFKMFKPIYYLFNRVKML